MIQMLDLAVKDFNITMTSVLNKIKEKIENMLEYHHGIKIYKKESNVYSRINNAICDIKTLMKRLDRTEYRIISEPKEM